MDQMKNWNCSVVTAVVDGCVMFSGFHWQGPHHLLIESVQFFINPATAHTLQLNKKNPGTRGIYNTDNSCTQTRFVGKSTMYVMQWFSHIIYIYAIRRFTWFFSPHPDLQLRSPCHTNQSQSCKTLRTSVVSVAVIRRQLCQESSKKKRSTLRMIRSDGFSTLHGTKKYKK